MQRWLENFTLYDLVGYFAVGVITYLSFDITWHWAAPYERLVKIWWLIGDLKIYQAVLLTIVAYMLGQVLGSISQFFYFKIPGLKKIKYHDYPQLAWKDWPGLRDRLLNTYGKDFVGTDAKSVFWLCVSFSRAVSPANYSDAFKWLVYSGASRSLSLVAVTVSLIALWKGACLYSLVLMLLALAFYYTFERMLGQYHGEVLNSVLLDLNRQLHLDHSSKIPT